MIHEPNLKKKNITFDNELIVIRWIGSQRHLYNSLRIEKKINDEHLVQISKTVTRTRFHHDFKGIQRHDLYA